MMLITFQLHAENIYFFHTTCNFEIEKSDHASTASMMVDKIDLESFSATCGVSNILANLIGDADETSGFTYNPDTETFFAVADAFLNNTGPGELYEINLNGELERIIVLNNFFGADGVRPDTEGITWLGGNSYAIADERKRDIILVEIDENTSTLDYNNLEVVDITDPVGNISNNGFEGVAYDAVNDILYIGKEGDEDGNNMGVPYLIYKVDGSLLVGGTTVSSPETVTTNFTNCDNGFDVSGLHVSPTGSLLVVSEICQTIYEIDPENGDVLSEKLINEFTNPEGITMVSDNELWIIGENNQIGKYLKTGSSCDDGDICTEGDVITTDCGCAGEFLDDDEDGICNALDQCPGFNNNLIGSTCDDMDECTSGDVYTEDCGCEGVFLDDDEDGICNALDQCEGFDDDKIGTTCVPTDPCYVNGIWTSVDGSCDCIGVFEDDDEDGICNADDQCPNFDDNLIGTDCDDMNDVYTQNCNCEGTLTGDDDDDGFCNAIDQCNNLDDNFIGTGCNDMNDCTILDIYVLFQNGTCGCEGTPVDDDDEDGICNTEDQCEGFDDGLIGTSCPLSDPCYVNGIWTSVNGNCECIGEFEDTDEDGICNAEDQCEGFNDEQIGTSCIPNDPCYVNGIWTSVNGNCECIGEFEDTDEDGVCDAEDLCPGGLDPGAECDDLNPNTIGDVVGIDCVCQGTEVVDETEICVMINSSYGDSEELDDDTIYEESTDIELIFDANRGNQTIGLRFENINVPTNAVITAASIQFTTDEPDSGTTNLLIEGHDADNSGPITETLNDITSRVRTSASVGWSPAPWILEGDAGDDQKTPDLSLIVQEIVDRSAYQSNGAMTFIISGSGERTAIAFDKNPAQAAQLCITYEEGDPGSDPCTTLFSDSFESGFGNWNDGGVDCAVVLAAANTGVRSLRIRDNSGAQSSATSDPLDLSPYGEVTFDFSYIAVGMEVNEDFFLEISSNGGNSYTTVQQWIRGIDFANNERIDENIVISGPFTDNVVFRLRCDASINNDRIFIDDILIEGCNGDLSCTPDASCDDGDECTVGDVYDEDCNCVGMFQDDDGDGVCNAEDCAPNDGAVFAGASCNDGDVCTIGDVYDEDCNCIGMFQDDDGDGVCNTEDCAPNDGAVFAGASCNDGDVCTTGETYDADCNCTGGVSTDNDSDGVCAAQDPDDNDACTPDSTNPNCNSEPCTTLYTDGFESGFGNWNDGGVDCAVVLAAANTGVRSLRIRDNSGAQSSATSDPLDLSSYADVTFDFSYIAAGMEVNEDFFLEISSNGGSTYSIVQQWIRGTDFNNDVRSNESLIIPGPFTDNVVFRLRCDASINNDIIFIDDIVITGCSGELDCTPGTPCDDGDPNTSYDTIDANCNCVGTDFGNNFGILCYSINSSYNDSEELVSDGSTYQESTDIELIFDGNRGDQVVGLRYENIGIPPSAIIVDARIQFTSDEINTEATALLIEGHDADNSAPITEGTNVISSRVRTSASTSWEPEPWTTIGADNTDQNTPNLNGIVQEIIDRPGYVQGGAMTFIISGTGERTSVAYDLNPDQSAELCITYMLAEGYQCVSDSDEDFENGYGFWNDGGTDCALINNSQFANSGNYSVRLRDNTVSSVVTSNGINLSNDEAVNISFSYLANSMEANEDFWLQISTDGGTTFTTVKEYAQGVDFNNDEREFESVSIVGPFSNDVRLRFRCDASGDADYVYIDDVEIESCYVFYNSQEPDDLELELRDNTALDSYELKVYPNPVSMGEEIIIEMPTDLEFENLSIYGIDGTFVKQIKYEGIDKYKISTTNISQGTYIISLQTKTGKIHKKIMVIN